MSERRRENKLELRGLGQKIKDYDQTFVVSGYDIGNIQWI